MLKKAAVVAAAVTSLSLVGSPAFATPAVQAQAPALASSSVDVGENLTYEDAFVYFIEGGGALGWGAAALVASAYTGIALTPALIAGSFTCAASC